MVTCHIILKALVPGSEGSIVLQEICPAIKTLHRLITSAKEIIAVKILLILQVVIIDAYGLVIGVAGVEVIEGDFEGFFIVPT